MEMLEKRHTNVPCVVFRRETLVVFNQPRIRHCEYLRRESVNSLSPKCRGLTVCQCQRDKKKRKEKTANEGVEPVFRYQMFFFTLFLTEGKMPNYLDSVYAKIYFHACEEKHEFR